MAKKSSGMLVLAIIGVVVFVLIMSPSLLSQLPTGGGSGSDFTGNVGLGFIIHYADGTEQTIAPQLTLSILPLVLTDTSGREIREIDVFVAGKLNVYTQVTSWSVSISQKLELYKKPQTVPKTSSTAIYSASGTSWTNGEQKTLYTTPLGWQSIENAIATYGDGDWSVQVTATVNLDASFSNGKRQTAQAGGQAVVFDFVYISGIQSWTATLTTTPLYP
jgi:hypothetical protein